MGLFSKWFSCMQGQNASQRATSTSESNRNYMRKNLSKSTLNSGSSQHTNAKDIELVNSRHTSDSPSLTMPASFSQESVLKQFEAGIQHRPANASSSTAHSQQELSGDVTTERKESNNAHTEPSTETDDSSVEEIMTDADRSREVNAITTTSNNALEAVTHDSQHTVNHHDIAPETRELDMIDILDPPPSYEMIVEDARPSQGTTTNAKEITTDRSPKRSITRIFSRRPSTTSTTKTAPASVTPVWKPTVCPPVPEQNRDPDRFTYVIGGRDFDDSGSIYCL